MPERSSDSLITAAMLAQIGVESSPVRYEVDKSSVRMFARAVGYTDPIYYDEEAAVAAGYRSLPCPPGYLGTPVFRPGVSDPTFGSAPAGDTLPEPPVQLPSLLDGGVEVEYFDDICAGDALTVTSRVSGLKERSGSLGRMLITTSDTVYRRTDGSVVAVVTATSIRY